MKKKRHDDYVAQVEKILTDAGRPYVAVDDAKKAIFAGANIDNFDLLIYMADGDHLLAVVLPPSRPNPGERQQTELAQWVKVFGTGFTGAFIHVPAGSNGAPGEPVAWTADRHDWKRLFRSVLSVGWERAESPADATPAAPESPKPRHRRRVRCEKADKCKLADTCDAKPPDPSDHCIVAVCERAAEVEKQAAAQPETEVPPAVPIAANPPAPALGVAPPGVPVDLFGQPLRDLPPADPQLALTF